MWEFRVRGNKIRDRYYERHTGICDFEEQDWGNNRFGRSGIQEAVGFVSDSFQIRRGNENSTRSEVASLPKILNGPQGNVISKTATSTEMLNGHENL